MLFTVFVEDIFFLFLVNCQELSFEVINSNKGSNMAPLRVSMEEPWRPYPLEPQNLICLNVGTGPSVLNSTIFLHRKICIL